MKESPTQRPHFPRILESRRRAQEQSNFSAPKAREAPPTGRVPNEAPQSAGVDEQR